MSKLRIYLLSNLSSVFFPIFFTLFAITSVIYLLKIATLTSVITMDFSELLFLYSLQISLILFYIIPITFFVSAIITIAKLSSEYELIVITSFGLSPIKILKIMVPISLLISILLMILSFVLIPKSLYIENTFINKKKQEARFNIKPSEYGQKFGPWYMYVEDKKDDLYKNIILYQNENGKDIFIIANNARLHNNKTSLSLELFEGTSSVITDALTYVEFKKMTINNHLTQAKQLSTLKDLINYWLKDRSKKQTVTFLKNILISLLPIISLLFFVSLGYFNPRYQKNYSTIYAIVFVIIYVILMHKMALTRELMVIYLLPMIWILLSVFVYRFRIKRYY